jgi:class 3 adenylate cyclase/predicted ATPase
LDIAAWLRGLGLERYVQAFRDNAVDEEVLPELDEGDLEKLGVLLGHRRKLLKAIAALSAGTAPATKPAAKPQPDRATTPISAAAPSEAERRQLTVMFCDLVGSTALSARLDLEDIREVIRAYQDAVAGEVARFEGVVAKFMGDGVLAYFGFPQAHEDDAERAVQAGLAIVEAVGRLRTPDGAPLAARVGIATGLVVVGDLVGSGPAQEQAVIGETPNLAARLQALAEPGAVLIAQGTRRLVGGLFDYADLGDQAVKGFAGPVRAWQVLGPSRAEGRFEALHGGGAALAPMVGREQEIALLLDRWQRAKLGEGQVVLLAGEPGIGKSRIAQVLHQHLGDELHIHLRYFCSPYRRDSTLHPVIDQLERVAGFERDDSPERKLDKLEALLARSTDDVVGAAPFLATLLAIPIRGRYPPLIMSPQRQKEKTLEVLVDQLEGLARHGPVLVVWEDGHWTDPTSLELLGLMIDRVQAIRALLMITFRPEFVPPWIGHAHVSALTLARLGQRQAATMVEHLTGGRALPTEVLEQIVAKTDGVPLFVEELTKAVLEGGLLRDEGDRYALVGPLPPLAIPATLHDSLMARLDRLAPVKEVAQIGAAIGREFSHELLAAVASMPSDRLEDALAQLCRSELVSCRGTPPEATYSFKHALIRDAAYGTLLRARRQQLHASIGRVLEERFPEIVASQPELLAHHCIEAGLAKAAIGYWLKAAQMAVSRSASAEALAQLDKGLASLDRLPHGPDRLRLELDLQSARGGVLIAAQGFAAPEAGRAWARARELCREVRDSPQIVKVLYGQYVFHLVRGDLGTSLAVAEEMHRLAEERGDVVLRLMGHRTVGVALVSVGELVRGHEHLERVLALYDPKQHGGLAVQHTFDPKVASLSYLSWTLLALGYPDQAVRCGGEAVSHARDLRHPSSLAQGLFFLGVLRQLLGDRRGTLDQAEVLVELATEQRFPFWLAGAQVLEGWALATEGRTEEGLARMRKGLAAYMATGARYFLPYLGALTVEAQRAGSVAESDLAEALSWAERTGERWFEPELHRLRGELLSHDRGTDEAETSFLHAIAVARQRGMRLWELRAATSLAKLWSKRGKRDEAHDLLAPVYGWFAEGFGTKDLQQARVLLGDLAATLHDPQPRPRQRSAAPVSDSG